jgi:hypothetical protein
LARLCSCCRGPLPALTRASGSPRTNRARASSKEAARWLNVSPRTIEFHRANIMQKLAAGNVADSVRIVVGNVERSEEVD